MGIFSNNELIPKSMKKYPGIKILMMSIKTMLSKIESIEKSEFFTATIIPSKIQSPKMTEKKTEALCSFFFLLKNKKK